MSGIPPIIWLALSAPITCLGLQIVLNWTLFSRRQPRSRIQVAARIAALVTLLNCALTSAALAGSDAGAMAAHLLFAAIASGCLAYCYFIFFTMGETARRIRILLAYYEGQILTGYGPGAMVETRIQRLLDMGAIREQNGRYFLNRGWLSFAASAIEKWRGLFFDDRA